MEKFTAFAPCMYAKMWVGEKVVIDRNGVNMEYIVEEVMPSTYGVEMTLREVV